MRVRGKAIVLGILASLLAILMLLPSVGPQVARNGSGGMFIAVMVIGGAEILITLLYASSRGILWESFLRPNDYWASAGESFGVAIVLAVLELPLAGALFFINYSGPRCSSSDTYWSGHCSDFLGNGSLPSSAFDQYATEGVMAVTVVLAGVALARALILAVYSVEGLMALMAVRAGVALVRARIMAVLSVLKRGDINRR